MTFERKDSWMEDAACKGYPPDAWHPTLGVSRAGRNKPPPASEAAPREYEICCGCPVRDQCLEYALKERIWEGIWGGYTVSERRKILKQRRAA